jgi:hypothetical protein
MGVQVQVAKWVMVASINNNDKLLVSPPLSVRDLHRYIILLRHSGIHSFESLNFGFLRCVLYCHRKT